MLGKCCTQYAIKFRKLSSGHRTGKGQKETISKVKRQPSEWEKIIARKDDEAFLHDQCKETEQNNRMAKTRDLFKKIRYQGNILCKNGHNKGQKTVWI